MTTTHRYDYSRDMTRDIPSEIMTKKELALNIGKSQSTVSRMIQDGRLPPPLRTPQGRVGGWFRFSIEQWKKANS